MSGTVHPAAAGPAVSPAPVRAFAALVPQDEAIILSVRPSFLFIVLYPLERLLAIAVVAGAAAWVGSRGWLAIDPLTALGAGVLAACVLILYTFLDWLTRLYVLTDRRVMRISGIIRQATFDAPLESIQNVLLYRSARERFTGLGTLVFTTAGPRIGDFSWFMIARPAGTVAVVRETLERYVPGARRGVP